MAEAGDSVPKEVPGDCIVFHLVDVPVSCGGGGGRFPRWTVMALLLPLHTNLCDVHGNFPHVLTTRYFNLPCDGSSYALLLLVLTDVSRSSEKRGKLVRSVPLDHAVVL